MQTQNNATHSAVYKKTGKETGTLKTYQNNNMSLSCSGELQLTNGEVVMRTFKGMPRACGEDNWYSFYTKTIVGTYVSYNEVKLMLAFNGRNNIVSTFVGAE